MQQNFQNNDGQQFPQMNFNPQAPQNQFRQSFSQNQNNFVNPAPQFQMPAGFPQTQQMNFQAPPFLQQQNQNQNSLQSNRNGFPPLNGLPPLPGMPPSNGFLQFPNNFQPPLNGVQPPLNGCPPTLNSFPLFQPLGLNFNPQNDTSKREIQELKKKNEELEQTLTEERQEYEKLKAKFTAANKELQEVRSMLDEETFQSNEKDKAFEKKIQKLTDQYDQEIKGLENKLEEVKESNQSLNKIIEMKNKSDFNLQNQQQVQFSLDQNSNQIKRMRNEIEQKDQKIQQLNQQLEKTEQDFDQKEKQFKDKIQDLTMQMNQSQNQYQQLLNEFESYKHQTLQDLNKNSQYINECQHQNGLLKINEASLERSNQLLQQELQEAYQRIDNIIQNNNQDDIFRQYIIKQNKEKEQKLRENLQQIEENRNYGLKKKEEEKKKKIELQKQLNQKGAEKKKTLLENLDKIQCCFLADIYKFEKDAKANLIKGIEEALKSIKQFGGRKVEATSLNYGKAKKKSQQLSFEFTEDYKECLQNLNCQAVEEYKDQPEDIKVALNTAQNSLVWTEKIKIIILIPSSPCHGKKYHDPKKYKVFWFFSKDYDSKPQEIIEDQIDGLIKSGIYLVIIRINEDTQHMCNQIANIYKSKNKAHMFFPLSLENPHKQQGTTLFKTLISDLAFNLIGMNNPTTKTKINTNIRQQNYQPALVEQQKLKQANVETSIQVEQLVQQNSDLKNQIPQTVSTQEALKEQRQFEEEAKRIQNQDGALQALCKRGDVENFENKAKTVQFSCTVYTVELKDQSFQNKKDKIHSINYQSGDFEVQKQSEWQCIRTENPFAFGMVKEVYLMKKQNVQNEIYVVKIPIDRGCYSSMKDAVNDCRSHLIAKNLMKTFINRLQEHNSKITTVQYTDFLLLEEYQGKIWLAERFFKGEFQKYNNNDGFIQDSQTPINKLAQAYSYFTYQESEFSYIVNDVQGIGNYFTDPAINTTQGDFDETDAGEEGITNFLGTLEVKKNLCLDLLSSINIEMD